MTGWRFFLVWMLTFLGFPVGGALAILLVGSIDGAADSALGGAAAIQIGTRGPRRFLTFPTVPVAPEETVAIRTGTKDP